MLSAALPRYVTYTPISGCPRCRGALFDDNCLCCGYDGPTRAPEPGERRRDTEPHRGIRPNRKYGGVAYRSLRGRAVPHA